MATASVLWAFAFVFDAFALAVVALIVSAFALVILLSPQRAGSEHASVGGRDSGAKAVPEREQPVASQRPADAPQPAVAFVSPDSLEPGSVVRALLENARLTGAAQAAHLWLSDATTGTLRLVASDGPAAPADRPLELSDPVLGRAYVEGTVITDEVNRITTPDSDGMLLVRVAYPIATGDLTGVAGVDYADHAPSGASITRLGSEMRLPLASALALNAARTRTKEAVGLIEAARELSRALDPADVIRISLERAMRLSGAATGSVMLLEPDECTLVIAEARGLPEDVVDTTSVSVGEGIAGWVASSGQPVLVEDLPGKKAMGQRHGVRSAVSVPIADDEGLLGVLNVGSRTYPARFTKEHLETLEMLGRQAAVALRNATAISSAGEIFFDTLKTLALALETKDPYAAGGTERVVNYAAGLATALKLPAEQRRAVEIAAILHDLGMSTLGPLGADCARPLSTMERALIKMHPVVASDILEQAPALREVAPIVYHHHEHFDGGGYVSGRAGDEIPVGARILSVADAYVAMTSDRPYRKALEPKVALKELSDKAGTQFDPDVVAAFVELLGSDSNRVPKSEGW